MPNIKSAEKRMRTSRKAHVKNVNVKSSIKTMRGRFFAAVTDKNKETAGKIYRDYCSLLDKSAKQGVITKNTSVRRKTRAARQLKALK